MGKYKTERRVSNIEIRLDPRILDILKKQDYLETVERLYKHGITNFSAQCLVLNTTDQIPEGLSIEEEEEFMDRSRMDESLITWTFYYKNTKNEKGY